MPLDDGPVDYVMQKDHPLYQDIAASLGDDLPLGAPADAQAKATRLNADRHRKDCVFFNTTHHRPIDSSARSSVHSGHRVTDRYTIGDFHVIHLQCLSEGLEDCDLEYKDASLQRVIAARRASAEHSRLLFEVHATEADLKRYGMYPGGKLCPTLSVAVPDGDGRPVAPEWAVPVS